MYIVDMNALAGEEAAAIAFYQKQIEAFRIIKKDAEKLQWSDKKYDEFVDSMNLIGSALSDMLQHLCSGHDVYVISQLMLAAEKYLQYEKEFPIL